MSILKCSRDSQVCQYNFADDGGAIGVIRLGLFTDNNVLFDSCFFQPLIPFNSGGLATVSFGLLIGGAFVAPTALTPALAFGGGPWVLTSPLFISQTCEIIMVIGGAPLTAGRIMVVSEYFNTDF